MLSVDFQEADKILIKSRRADRRPQGEREPNLPSLSVEGTKRCHIAKKTFISIAVFTLDIH